MLARLALPCAPLRRLLPPRALTSSASSAAAQPNGTATLAYAAPPLNGPATAPAPLPPDGLDRRPHARSARGVLRGLDLAGTAVFAASGAAAAGEAGFDALGAVAVGTVTAVGGGTLRDVVILGRAPFWSGAAAGGGEPEYLWVAAAAALAAFVAASAAGAYPDDAAPDAVALGAFAVIGAMNGARLGLPAAQSLLCGVVTATGGGTIRDVWLRRPVRVFHAHKEVYATCAAAGAGVFLALPPARASFAARAAAGVGATVAARAAAIAADARLPAFAARAPAGA